jgi:hypothetical protein
MGYPFMALFKKLLKFNCLTAIHCNILLFTPPPHHNIPYYSDNCGMTSALVQTETVGVVRWGKEDIAYHRTSPS